MPRVGDVQALSASVQCETQPAVRKATSTQGGGGEGGRLKQQGCFLSRFMHTEHKDTSLPARLTLPEPSKAGGDKALTVVTPPTLGLRTLLRKAAEDPLLSAAPASLSSSAHSPSSSPPSSLYWSSKVFPDLYLKKRKTKGVFPTLPATTSSNPQPVGIFSLPDTASSFHRLKHCQTLQHTQGRAGTVSPQLQSPEVSFHIPGERTALADQKMGWPTELSGLRLGSRDIFLLFDHSSCHPSSCTAGVMRKKIYITVFMEQNKEGANQSNPSYQPVSSAMRNIQKFSQPRHIHLLF